MAPIAAYAIMVYNLSVLVSGQTCDFAGGRHDAVEFTGVRAWPRETTRYSNHRVKANDIQSCTIQGSHLAGTCHVPDPAYYRGVHVKVDVPCDYRYIWGT